MNEGSVRLLRATLQARGNADPSPECLDAGTVAAWADGTLGRDERRAAEAHAADCGRCQALVAAMAQTAPPAPGQSWWRAPVMRWLVPLTTAAAALLVWMIVPGTPRGAPGAGGFEGPSTSMASNASDQESSPPQAAVLAGPPPDITLSESGAAKVNSRGETKAARGGEQRSAPGGSRSAPATVAKSLSSEAAGGPPLPASSMPIPATAVPPELQPPDADRAAAGRKPAGGQRTAVAQLELANAALALGARRLTTVIASTNPASQWRILANGAVQHSTDGGNSWEVQPTGAPVTLTAGASPAPSICWLVGPQGIVVLSTDGRSWRRIAFPVTDDLTSVRATDDKNATVNTSDGRAFSTTDGGQTWTR